MLSDERGISIDLHLELALAAARGGDERGFAELWRHIQPAMIRYCRILAGDAAEDAASKTWLQTARQLRCFQGDYAQLRVWLFRTARHQAIQSQDRTGHGHIRDGNGLMAAKAWRDLDRPMAAAAGPSITDAALLLLAQLPSDQAEAVALRVVAGLDVTQTAQVLGVSDEEARTAAVEGVRRLAAIMQDPARRTTESAPGNGEQTGEGMDL